MSSRTFSGSTINKNAALKRVIKLTRSQTAKQAKAAITKKYGKVRASEKYYHAGKGNWVKYSLSADRRKTAKGKWHLADVEKNEAKWMKNPHKYDIGNKDTARGIPKKKPVTRKLAPPPKKKTIPTFKEWWYILGKQRKGYSGPEYWCNLKDGTRFVCHVHSTPGKYNEYVVSPSRSVIKLYGKHRVEIGEKRTILASSISSINLIK